MNQEDKAGLIVGGGAILFFLVCTLICVGPAGLKTQVSGWWASSYGSDWLVVQYAQSGCRIAQWELENEAIQNEGSSDGIYFVAEDGSVIHLSGHYNYVQYPTDQTREALTSTPLCYEQ